MATINLQAAVLITFGNGYTRTRTETIQVTPPLSADQLYTIEADLREQFRAEYVDPELDVALNQAALQYDLEKSGLI